MAINPKLIDGVLAKAKLVMTEWQYELFEARYGEDRGVEEIAEDYEISKSAVYKVLKRAREKMKRNWR